MSEPKFTKGPWKLFNKKGDVVSTETGDLIVKWDACHTEEQQLADSALIAAAPELYRMLEKMLMAAKTANEMNPVKIHQGLLRDVEETLKEARGEE